MKSSLLVVVYLGGCVDAEPALLRRFPLETELSFGRDEGVCVQLPAPEISRVHLRVSYHQGGFSLRDSSSLGTKCREIRHKGEDWTEKGEELELYLGRYLIKLKLEDTAQDWTELRRKIHRQLVERLEAIASRRKQEGKSFRAEQELEPILQELLSFEGLSPQEQLRVHHEIRDETLGLGPLESLLAEPEIQEILVLDPGTIFVEKQGRLQLTGKSFSDAESMRVVVERIVSPLGRRIDESSPIVDARLPDGSRVHAVIPPIALRGPCLTIRKFASKPLRLEQLVAQGSLSQEMADFLILAVQAKRNIVVSGGTGSGKTTLLGVLAAQIPPEERIITIEDAAELKLSQAHVVRLECRPRNLEGSGELGLRELLRAALRMRPDRIIVGECRGGEALDMLQAMNTGHEGSMTTTHANSPEETIARLETLCLMSGLELPLLALRRQLASSLHLLVQTLRLPSGERKITRIAEVQGLSPEGEVELQELFRYVPGSQLGFVAAGYLSSLVLSGASPEAGESRPQLRSVR